jgi:hypothetical protein
MSMHPMLLLLSLANKHNAMKTCGGVDIHVYEFLTSAIVGGEWSASRPCRFTPMERAPGTHWTGGWVGLRTSLDDMERRKILSPTGTRTPSSRPPASSHSLYRLSYLGSCLYDGNLSELLVVVCSFENEHSFVGRYFLFSF